MNMTTKRPNLLLVFPDQMRGQALGFLGEEPVITPNLDAFASQSLVFNNACCTYPVCSPFRAMLMTGRYPFSNGVISNCNTAHDDRDIELSAKDVCWSDILAANGYSLGYIGKWHLDKPREPYIECLNNAGTIKWNEWCSPERRHGFDFWYSYGTYDEHLRPMYWDGDSGREDYHFVDKWGPEHEADLAIEYLRNTSGSYRDPAQPFALVVSMNPPHTPYNRVPKEYLQAYDGVSDEELCTRGNIDPYGTKWGDFYRAHIRNYYAMITGVDRQFARILETLEMEGLADDTIVIFTSDHGNCLGIHGEITKNNPYEESLRIPFIIRWPGRIMPGRDAALLSAPDIYPTLLDLMGLADSVPAEVEGISFAERILGCGGELPSSQFCLSIRPDALQASWRALRDGRFTLVARRSESGEETLELFDREEDPFQLEDVSGSQPEVMRRMLAELERWLIRSSDPWSEHQL